jgi:hypothetical protein
MSNPAVSMSEPEPQRHNLRTAFILLSVVLVFFAGVIVNRWLFG